MRIGVITSPTGAALRDILHILSRRFPAAAVLVYPVPVQGAAAAPSIAAALDLAAARAECDVLILARGGGSLEDLWAFNDERVARAIFRCTIPLVSGIGHEIDFTIADFVADVRAPTPSGAAELVAPDRLACLDVLMRGEQRLIGAIRREVRAIGTRLSTLERQLQVSHPGVRLQQQLQRLDDLAQRLSAAVRSGVQRDGRRLAESHARLLRRSPQRLLSERRAWHEALEARLEHAWNACIASATHRTALAQRALHTVSPLATLARGFAIVTRADGTLLTDAAAARTGDEIEARLACGVLGARVTGHK
jgi:exodeoxyribonuclease VII large subunit